MGKAELDNLVEISKLKLEPGSRAEFEGMAGPVRSDTGSRCGEASTPGRRMNQPIQ